MKLATSLALLLALTAAGCSKKKEEGTVRKDDPSLTPKVTEPAKQDPPPAKPLEGAALADKYKACTQLASDGKFDDFRKECVADSYTGHAVAGMPETKGPEALIGFMKNMKTAMPDWKLQPQLIVVSGRTILSVVLATGTQTGPLKTPTGEVPPTNKKVGHLMLQRLAISQDNKATDEWVYADALTMMGQLGLAPKGTPSRPVMDKGIDGAPIVVVTADDAKEKENFAAAKKIDDAFVANKPADIMALYADDAIEADQASPMDLKGKKDIQKGVSSFRGAFSDVKMSNVDTWAAGDYVVETYKFEGKNDKDMGPMKKTGKTVAVDGAAVTHFKNGKVDQVWRFSNGADFMTQLGLMPAPGAAPAAGSAAPAAAPAAGSAAPAASAAPAPAQK